MNNVILETRSGRIRPSLAGPPISASNDRMWNGCFLHKCGPTSISARDVMLLKHAVCLQLDQPAQIDWTDDHRTVSKTIEPGQVSIFPANKLHTGTFSHRGTHVTVFFEPRFLVDVMDSDAVAGSIELSWQFGIDSAPLRELILLLQNESVRPGSTDNRAATAIARLIAIHLVQLYSNCEPNCLKPGGLSPTRLKRVLDFIERSPANQLSLERLAFVAELSVFHFSRVFRHSTGVSPIQYVMNRRISRARELLLQRSARINDVALECGFCDQSHLTRHFKRLTGVTPAAFVREAGRCSDFSS